MKFAWWCRDDDKYPPNWWTPGSVRHIGGWPHNLERYWLSHVWWLHKETVVLWFWWATTDKNLNKKKIVSTFHLEGRKRASVLFSSRLVFPKSSCPTSPILAIDEKKKKSDTVPESSIIIGRERERNNKVMLTSLPSLVRWCPLSYYSILSCGKKTTRLTPSSPPVDDDDNNNKL